MGAGASGAKKANVLADTGQRRAIAEVERRALSDSKTRPDVEVDDLEIVGSDVSPLVESEIEEERRFRLNADRAELSLDQILAKKDDIRKHAQTWIQNTRPPSTFVRMPNLEFAPDELLKLSYVYGYRGWDCRANLFYTVTDEILFNNGRLCVAMNPENRRQRFFRGHERDVTAIAIHPVGNVAASGDSGPLPVILVWDISSLDVLARITDLHDVGIAALCFAGNGNRLVTIGRDVKTTVAVWDWKNKKKAFVAQATLSMEKVFVCACNPVDDTIVVAGSRRLKFFRLVLSGTGQRVIQQTSASVSRMTSNASAASHPSHLCVAFTQSTDSIFKQFEYSQSGLILTGASNGTIYLWKKDANEDSIVAAHKGPVLGLASFKEGFMSCGADGRIRIWNNGLQPTNSHDIGAYLRSDQMVNAISIKGGRVAIGTKTSIILELEEDIGRFTIVLSGHVMPSVNAVIAHPTRSIVATGGDDSTVRMWDYQQHLLLKTHHVPHPAICIHFDPSGKLAAVGMKDGHWGVWVAETWEEVIQSRDRKRDITCIKFAPNGRYVAAGSKDGFIDLYDVLADYEWTGTLQGHSDPICALDWSLSCVFLQTCDLKDVQFLWNTKSQELVTAADVIHNMEYETWTSPVGWPVQGAVGAGDRNTCFVRSLSSTLLATGNTDGVLRLYKYPCIVTGAEPSILSIHSGSVNAVCFSFDDNYLFTVSNTDHSLFQFSITNPGDVEEAIPEAEIIGFGGSPGKSSPQKSPTKGSPTKKAPGAIPSRDTGKGLPGKQTKRSGGIISDGTLGEDGAGGEGEVPPAEPGQPEVLGEPEDKASLPSSLLTMP
jgi:WD40 repeat protein